MEMLLKVGNLTQIDRATPKPHQIDDFLAILFLEKLLVNHSW